ncbi:hypothetical protein FsymDg_2641 [Candidatus Protofrankia datiscae]|uniref:Uncharacterized protein n=1 Tax=Candidatus Protofrankia datiscae TaxID=2716812 RepID=F8B3Y5_9ACTN|nr:hypothetical protein FsymDg_2641 [Candidatus Protofrankia datiscae]
MATAFSTYGFLSCGGEEGVDGGGEGGRVGVGREVVVATVGVVAVVGTVLVRCCPFYGHAITGLYQLYAASGIDVRLVR